MKIYADENIERSIIKGLIRRGIEVISASELAYYGRPDEFHLMKASELKAIILTHDTDFLLIASAPGVSHQGIIFSHSGNVSVGQCIRGVELITTVLSAKDMKNHIEFL